MYNKDIEKNNLGFLLNQKVYKARTKIWDAINCTLIDYNSNPTEVNRFNYENEKYVMIDNIKISRKKANELYSSLSGLIICCDLGEKIKIIKDSKIRIPFILKYNNSFWSDFQTIINKVKKY